MTDLRSLSLEQLTTWLQETYNIGHSTSSLKNVQFHDLLNTCNSLKTFPWDFLMDLSTDKTKNLMRIVYCIFIRLFFIRKDLFLLSFDALLSSLKKTLSVIESYRPGYHEWLSLLASFTSDIIIGAILNKDRTSEDGLISSLLILQRSSNGRNDLGARFVVEVLFYCLDFACRNTSEFEGHVHHRRRQAMIKSVVDARGLGKRLEDSDFDISKAIKSSKTDISDEALIDFQKLFARVIWEVIIELEHDVEISGQKNASSYQFLDEISCIIAKTVQRNSRIRKCLFNEIGNLLILIAGSKNSRKFVAIPYLFFLLSVDGQKATHLLRKEIESAIHQKLYIQAMNLVLFLSSYCVRAPMFFDLKLMSEERIFLERLWNSHCKKVNQQEPYLIFRHAVAQSMIYLLYVERCRQGEEKGHLDPDLLSLVDIQCIVPSILQRFQTISKISLEPSGYVFPGNAEDALTSLCWFPFDPCRLSNLWEMVKSAGFNYVL